MTISSSSRRLFISLYQSAFQLERPLPPPLPGMSDISPADGNIRLFTLPRELIDNILQLLDSVSFINLVFADYYSAWYRGIVPPITPLMLRELRRPSPNLGDFHARNIPNEIMFMILRNLSQRDAINFVLGNYHDLRQRRIAPSLTGVTLSRIRYTWLHCKDR